MLIDTHCHIHDQDTYNFALSRQQISSKFLKKYPACPHEKSDFTPEKIISRAHAAGVKQMICIGTSALDSKNAQDFAKRYHDQGIFWTYGIHPDEADKIAPQHQSAPAFDFTPLPPVAIGEVGLDYREGAPRPGVAGKNNQIKLFENMLQLATDQKLPVVFHVRDAFADFFAVVKNFPKITGVVHSFSDSKENLEKSLNLGFLIGVNGLATFAPEIPLPPLESLLLETDAPFLTPRPFRGKINEPAHVKDVCKYLSDRLALPEKEIEGRTTENARRLFKLPPD